MSAESIASEFEVPGRVVTLLSIDSGNVNDTFRVISRTTFSEEQFILQRINRTVFPEPAKVMANMKAITDHAHQRIKAEIDLADRIWQLPRVIPARDGRDFVIDEDGEYWRALSLIASATSHETVLNIEHAREAGEVLGHFHCLIADF
ncbi:MAG: aminoglycoside phosphotransferase, partial [Verrucomicrobiales bacterium]